MDTDRLEFHLENWARWMQTGGKSEFKVHGGHSLRGFTHYDTESAYEQMDISSAKATDAAIGDLKPLERAAINCEYLGAKWTYEGPQHAVLAIARHAVRMGLERRSIV